MTYFKSRFFIWLPWAGFLIANIAIRSLRLFPGFYRRQARLVEEIACLAIEAGIQGWNSIEFKELNRSACGFMGSEAVRKIEIDKSIPYVPQVEAALSIPKITHYLYDPRTGRQDYWGAFLDSLKVAILLGRYRVTPIVYLTDFSFRRWRLQAAAVSAVSGLVVIFMLPKQVQLIFPHRRLIGPTLMPLSIETLDWLNRIRLELIGANSIQRVVRFTGSLYEPRTSFLRSFSNALGTTEHRAEILGREFGSPRVPDEEYWIRLSSAAIVITTADQAVQPGTDWAWIPHLVYRYLEVLASGSLLLAPPLPGVSRYFEPGKHFVGFESLEEAIEKARFYLDHPQEAETIRMAGHEKAEQLIRMNSFWVQIDTALGNESFSA